MSLDVGPTSDFEEARLRLVHAGRRQIGVVRWRGMLYAVHNYCPHQGGPLCLGVLSGRLEAERPGTLLLNPLAPILACPWHGWEFDLRTGGALPDPTTRVRTFPVREVDGRVFVDAEASAGEPGREFGTVPQQSADVGAA